MATEFYQVGPDNISDDEFQAQDNFRWIVYWYEVGGYDGGGEAVGLRNDGMLCWTDLSHCSCFGPIDGGFVAAKTMSIDAYLTPSEDALSRNWDEAVQIKVRELLGRPAVARNLRVVSPYELLQE